jgi:hypothetical protein
MSIPHSADSVRSSSWTLIASERPARGVHGLVEVVRGPVWLVLRPEVVDQLAAVQRASRGERQQLDERARLPQPPGVLRNPLAVDGRRETAEQPDFDAHRSPTLRRMKRRSRERCMSS